MTIAAVSVRSAHRSSKGRTARAAEELLLVPTGRNEWVGPVGRGTLEPFAYEKPVMERLWELSEQETGCTWQL